MRLLIVCLGNICRSPTAEAILRAKAPHLTIDSAGTGNWHIGNPPHPPMIAAAHRHGYDLTPLRARQIHPADATEFDLILAADRSVLTDLGVLATTPELLAPYAGTGLTDIPDPYFTGDFDGAVKLIEAACDGLLAHIDAEGSGAPH